MTTSDEFRVVHPSGGEKGQKGRRYDLLPADVLDAAADHFGAGAAKYEDRNWERGYEYSLSYGALMRHLQAWWQGEELDEEGNHHMDAVLFHAMVLRAFQLRDVGEDDRPWTHDVNPEDGFFGEPFGFIMDETLRRAIEEAGQERRRRMMNDSRFYGEGDVIDVNES